MSNYSTPDRPDHRLLTFWWHYLVEPAARIQDENRRYQSRQLTSFLLILALLFIVLMPVALLVKPGIPWFDTEFVLMWLTPLVLLALSGFSRTGSYERAAVILIGYGAVAISIEAWLIGGQMGLQILDFLVLTVVFATFFLSLRAAVAVWTLQFVMMIVTLLAMGVSLELASFPLRFYLVVGGLFLLVIYNSRRLDQERRARLAGHDARYRALVENARDLVYTLSLSGEMTSLNPAFEALTGWPLDKITGSRFFDFVHPDYLPLAMASIQATLNGEKPGPFEVPIRAETGDYLWIEFNNSPIVQDGKMLAIAGVARVVEERKQLESALLHSEELYRTLIHHFPEGAVFLFDADLRYQIVDGQALTSMGVEKERLEGRTIWKSLPPDLISKFEPVYRSALEGSVSVHEMTIGERVYRVQTVPVSDDRGDIQSGMAVVQDVTGWRAAEDRFRAMFEYSPDAIFLADPETVAIVDCNEVAAQMNGYSRDELIGQRMLILMPDVLTEGIEDCKQQWQDMTVPQFEMMRLRKDGTTFPVEATTTLIQVAGKQLLLGLERDITSRKQAEAERLQLALEQERLAMLGQFVQAISHEFRNTLSLVETGRYLIERSLPEAVRQPITPRLISIQESVARLNEQLDNLNTISSLSKLHYSECDLNQLVESLVIEYTTRAQQKHQRMQFEPSAPLSPIRVDTEILRQAIKQLIVNAQNFTPEEGVIRLYTRQDEKRVQVCVEDTGIGIGPEHLPHVFELFYRIDPARQVASGGVGIGLSIARMIAEAHSGQIHVESTLGEGSTFTLTIPAAS